MHILNLVKTHWDSLKLLTWKYNTGELQTDKSKIDDLPISNLKASLHNINAMHIPSLVKINI